MISTRACARAPATTTTIDLRSSYKYLAATSNKLRGNRGTGKKSGKEDGMPEVLSENYPWFRRSIMVFKRQTPIVGLGCTPKWAKKVGLSGS